MRRLGVRVPSPAQMSFATTRDNLGTTARVRRSDRGDSSRCRRIRGGVPERSKGTDCKSVGEAFGGSNPPPSTIHGIFHGLVGSQGPRAYLTSAGIAQWLERQPSKLRVAGSNPVSRSILERVVEPPPVPGALLARVLRGGLVDSVNLDRGSLTVLKARAPKGG